MHNIIVLEIMEETYLKTNFKFGWIAAIQYRLFEVFKIIYY